MDLGTSPDWYQWFFITMDWVLRSASAHLAVIPELTRLDSVHQYSGLFHCHSPGGGVAALAPAARPVPNLLRRCSRSAAGWEWAPCSTVLDSHRPREPCTQLRQWSDLWPCPQIWTRRPPNWRQMDLRLGHCCGSIEEDLEVVALNVAQGFHRPPEPYIPLHRNPQRSERWSLEMGLTENCRQWDLRLTSSTLERRSGPVAKDWAAASWNAALDLCRPPESCIQFRRKSRDQWRHSGRRPVSPSRHSLVDRCRRPSSSHCNTDNRMLHWNCLYGHIRFVESGFGFGECIRDARDKRSCTRLQNYTILYTNMAAVTKLIAKIIKKHSIQWNNVTFWRLLCKIKQ